jgi:hypothetical protein
MTIVHEITVDAEGNRHGTDGTLTVSLLGTEGRMFKRRAVKGVGSGAGEETCWLVAELNGVRVYQEGANVIVTTDDLYP